MAVLNELFGVAWIPAAVIMGIGFLDIVTGGFMFHGLMYFLDLDGYYTLREKYSDPDREIFRTERHWAYDNYSAYLHAMLCSRQFKKAWQLRKAKQKHDYLTLYNMERAWDGDKRAKQWLERDEENE